MTPVFKLIPVDTYIKHAYCECGEELIRGNIVLTSNPPKYKYMCHKCNKQEYLDDIYPKLVYIDKEGKEL